MMQKVGNNPFVSLEPEEAYGHRDESLTQKFSRAGVPPEMNPRMGDTVGLCTADGRLNESGD